jgi:small-conductance mechanosensitive channel
MLDWQPWTVFAAALVGAVVAAVILAALVALPFRFVARRRGWDPKLLGKMRRPFRILLLVIGVWIAVNVWLPPTIESWRGRITHLLLIAAIACGGWLLGGIVSFLFARVGARYPRDHPDTRAARRVTTQLSVISRVAAVVIAVATLGAILLTFPGIAAVGTSLLASAGIASVVVGLAAQSTLSNLFAGVQLAFSGAIRVDDVVVVTGLSGRIEEITLTYVVVRVWDDRRLVVPSTYFTTTPFENWTRDGSALVGSVELDVDWQVDVAGARAEVTRLLQDDARWDGRTANVQVTDATGGLVRIRVLVSAADSGALWDLRCAVREHLVEWMREQNPAALPLRRVAVRGAPEAH